MTRATRCEHPSWSHRANDLLLEAQFATGQFDLARRLLERVDPDRAKARYRIPWARFYWRDGNRGAAAECFARVLSEVMPRHPGYIARQTAV